MQGSCDDEGRRFIDVSICYPASTSNYLAFSTSKLKHKIEKRGFLAKGLCLYIDNAYVNTFYMVTPFKGKKGGMIQFAEPPAMQAMAVTPEAKKMMGGTSTAMVLGGNGNSAMGTTVATGMAMDVDNAKKWGAPSPK
jgi:hypothetical protein